jgi:hypothetical protein
VEEPNFGCSHENDVGLTLLTNLQRAICNRFGATPELPSPDAKMGLSETAVRGLVPLNGLRHPAEAGTCGWYVWGGEELLDDADFFSPVCVRHLIERCPAAADFLALPPGWRFLVAPGHVDVWFDESLLRV